MSASELFSPPPPSSSLRLSLRRPVPLRRLSVRPNASANGHDAPNRRAIGRAPEPPWLVHPPAPPENPFAADLSLDRPSPLRMLQMRRRLAAASAPPRSLPDTPAARAVSALLFMIGELQRPAFEGQEALDRVSRDRKDSFVWLFRRVFSNSPNLVPMVLMLLSSFIAASAERATMSGDEEGAAVATEERKVEIQEEEEKAVERPAVDWNYKNWYDVGIREGELAEGEEETAEAAVERRRRAYERAIAEGEVNSLLLCNYAQLLYKIAHDHGRAEHYFRWASMAEPRDAEAIGHYALFMWEARGDFASAEELFLEALDVDPDSFYHSSNYAWFLWKTGAEDTCFPLTPFSPAM